MKKTTKKICTTLAAATLACNLSALSQISAGISMSGNAIADYTHAEGIISIEEDGVGLPAYAHVELSYARRSVYDTDVSNGYASANRTVTIYEINEYGPLRSSRAIVSYERNNEVQILDQDFCLIW